MYIDHDIVSGVPSSQLIQCIDHNCSSVNTIPQPTDKKISI